MVASAAACAERVRTPAIGLTYSWGDPALEAFFQSEIDRTRPADGDSIRLVGSIEGGWRTYAASALAAEVQRASILSADPEVVAVVGPGGSREALQVAPIYAREKLPDLVPTATSRLLSTAGAYTFVLAPDDSVQGDFLAAFADTALGVRRLAIFYVPDEYGIGLAAGTAVSAGARGLALLDRTPIRLLQDCGSAAERTHYDDIAAQLARRGTPDAVVIAARTVEAACLTRALRSRWPHVDILGGDGIYPDASFFVRAGAAAEGVHLVAFWHPDLPSEESRAFRARFEQQLGRLPRHGDAVFFDAAMLAATAIRAVGADRQAVTAYFRSLGTARPPYPGVSGPIAFGAASRRALLMTLLARDGSQLVGFR